MFTTHRPRCFFCPLRPLACGVISLLLLTLAGCATDGARKTGVMPVTVAALDLHRYLGTWYEIARLPHFFEKDLDSVTATYTLNPDGTVKVHNRGYHTGKGKWQEISGRAWRANAAEPGRLKVRFFWPFTADYRVVALDTKDYGWAVVSGPNRNYFWILARTPAMDEMLYAQLVQQAAAWGFDTTKLIRVKHERAGP